MDHQSRQDAVAVELEPAGTLGGDVAAYSVAYRSQGMRVKGLLLAPRITGLAPGLVYCRGGIGRFGMVRPERVLPWARRGFVVFAPYYRGNEGGEGREDFGGEDRFDVYSALKLLRSLPQVSAEPIALVGFSRGSVMALRAAADCPEAGPVVVWGGVGDLGLTYEERTDLRRMLRRVVGHPRKRPDAYRERSPVCWAERIPVPVLIVHGRMDEQVGVEHARRLADALKAAGADYELRIYDGCGHHFPQEQLDQAHDMMAAWIRGKLSLNGQFRHI